MIPFCASDFILALKPDNITLRKPIVKQKRHCFKYDGNPAKRLILLGTRPAVA
jgi:hypothetical protein